MFTIKTFLLQLLMATPAIKCSLLLAQTQPSLQNTSKPTTATQKTSLSYLRDAESFSGMIIKMVAMVSMVTECVLLCEKQKDCEFSVLDTQNCTLYSMKTDGKTRDQVERTRERTREQAVEVKGFSKNERPPCRRVTFKTREHSQQFDEAPTTKTCPATYAYQTGGCYHQCGRKTGWCTNYCGVDRACCRRYPATELGADNECALSYGHTNRHNCIKGTRHGSLDNSAYIFVNYNLGYTYAIIRCSRLQADLVNINSTEEFEYVNSFMLSDFYLVGYQKPNGTTQWRWNNDENFEPTWCPAAVETHSNLIGHYYGLVYRPKMCMDWISRDRHSSYNFICKKTNEI